MFHLTNPSVCSWSGGFVKDIASLFSPLKIRLVEFPEWLMLLEKSAEHAGMNGDVDVEKNPAVRLIDFYSDISDVSQGPRMLRSEKAQAASKELKNIGPVNKEWVRNWMAQWGILGDVGQGTTLETSWSCPKCSIM